MTLRTPSYQAIYEDANVYAQAWIAKVTTRSGDTYVMTTLDQPWDSWMPDFYDMDPTFGVTTHAVRLQTGVEPGNTELKGLIGDDEDTHITLNKLINGEFRGATAEVAILPHRWPMWPIGTFAEGAGFQGEDAGSASAAPVWQKYDVTRVEYDQMEWSFDLSDLRSRYNRRVGSLHAVSCQNSFGQVVPSPDPISGVVSSIEKRIVLSFCQFDTSIYPVTVANMPILSQSGAGVVEPRREFILFDPSGPFTPTLVPGTSFEAFGDNYFALGYCDFPCRLCVIWAVTA